MKKTAIEWLVEQVNSDCLNSTFIRLDVIEQAKEMEKEQIINAHRDASLEAGFEHSADDWANEYWDNNYKNKETWQK